MALLISGRTLYFDGIDGKVNCHWGGDELKESKPSPNVKPDPTSLVEGALSDGDTGCIASGDGKCL